MYWFCIREYLTKKTKKNQIYEKSSHHQNHPLKGEEKKTLTEIRYHSLKTIFIFLLIFYHHTHFLFGVECEKS